MTIIPPKKIDQWRPIRFVRLCLRRNRRARRERAAYRRWIAVHESQHAVEPAPLDDAESPLVSILLTLEQPAAGDPRGAIDAVHRQSHRRWELLVVGDDRSMARLQRTLRPEVRKDPRIRFVTVAGRNSPAVNANHALAIASGRYIIRAARGVLLATDAIRCLAAAIGRHPQGMIFYGDEDRVDRWGRRSDPSFKGDFNHVLLLTHDALSHPVACDRLLALELGGWREEFHAADDYDFVLRAVNRCDSRRIVHVPSVLCHRRLTSLAQADASAAGRRAVAAHLDRAGISGSVEAAPEAPGHHRVRLALPTRPPLVSIVICTRDQANLLGRCIKSLRGRTTYPSYEIIVVDNGSTKKDAVALLASLARLPGIEVVRDESPFNFSRLNNAAVSRVRGEVACLLNDDTEVLTPNWLEEMVGFALLEDVGAVGARLWYPNGTLQHGGVILNADTIASHAFARYPRGDAGYRCRAAVQQELSAVTAACLVVRRSAFLAVGGFDEQLAVAFNDVDLCLRLRNAGFRTVWTPYAELIHYESMSRGRDEQPSQRERYRREMALMRTRWGDLLARDPWYGPHFSRRHADYSIVIPSRARDGLP